MKAFLKKEWGRCLTLLAAIILSISYLMTGKQWMALAWLFLGLTQLAILYTRYTIDHKKK